MNEQPFLLSRRDAFGVALAAGMVPALAGLASTAAAQTRAPAPADPELDRRRHDWDWLVGSWNVRHRRLKERLTGSAEWEEFDGTSLLWLTLDGLGTVDDNMLELPAGTYRAVGIRAFDATTGLWSIWWLDARSNSIDPPVRGRFEGDSATFTGDDMLRGRPVKVRFRWTDIHSAHPRWEQAFSPDDGETWEVNWRMRFTRAA